MRAGHIFYQTQPSEDFTGHSDVKAFCGVRFKRSLSQSKKARAALIFF